MLCRAMWCFINSIGSTHFCGSHFLSLLYSHFSVLSNVISQFKKVQLLRVGIRFLCSSNFQKVRRKLSVVEMRGVEPLSNILSIPASPSAVCYQNSLLYNLTNKLIIIVAIKNTPYFDSSK